MLRLTLKFHCQPKVSSRGSKGIVYGLGATIGDDVCLDDCRRDPVSALFNPWCTLGKNDSKRFSGGGFVSIRSRGGCCFDSCFIVHGGGHIVSSRTAAELGTLDSLHGDSDTGFQCSVKLDHPV